MPNKEWVNIILAVPKVKKLLLKVNIMQTIATKRLLSKTAW